MKSGARTANVADMANETVYTSSSETTSLFITEQLLQEISGNERNVVVIESPRVADLAAQFRHFALRSGTPIYLWSADHGIASLRELDFVVPGSQRLPDALRHVIATLHAGIYVFVGASKELKLGQLAVLRQIARPGNAVAGRKLVLLDVKVRLPENMENLVHRIVHDVSTRRPPRLRDGRWVC